MIRKGAEEAEAKSKALLKAEANGKETLRRKELAENTNDCGSKTVAVNTIGLLQRPRKR